MKKNTLTLRKMTLGAILCALSVVFLYLGSVIEVLDLTAVAFASMLCTFAVMEMGTKYALLLYLATSVLSFLMLPSKLPCLLYAFLMGLYPLLKFRAERWHPVLCLGSKVLFFNLTLTATVYITTAILGMQDAGLGFEIPVYALGNVTYIVYDIALSRVIASYQLVWRKRLRIGRFFGN